MNVEMLNVVIRYGANDHGVSNSGECVVGENGVGEN